MCKKGKNQDLEAYLSKGTVTIFTVFTFVGCMGLLVDIISFSEVVTVVFYNNLITFIITLAAYLLFRFYKLNIKISFAIVLYAAFGNFLVTSFVNMSPLQNVNFFLRDSLFVIFMFTLMALFVDKRHIFVLLVLYIIAVSSLVYIGNDEFLRASIVLIIFLFSFYSIIIFYIVELLEKSILVREENSRLLSEQNRIVKETNYLLQEKQTKIEKQAQELAFQAEELKEQKELLLGKNSELGHLILAKDKFISILAHDLRSPFNSILGIGKVLETDFSEMPDPEKLKLITALNASSNKTFNLLEDLLQWANSQINSIKYHPKKFNLSHLLSENISFIEEACEAKNIKISDNIYDKCFIYADQQMVNTIIRNLLSNAIKFTSTGGTIKITCRNINNEIVVDIADTGIGMDKYTQEKLFKIDTSFSSSGTQGETGTGLGLLLCKDFIVKCQGKIWFTSKTGVGSTFSFSFPVFKK